MHHDGHVAFFPCKKAYDLHRNLPSSLPVCIIRDVSKFADCDVFEEKPDSEDVSEPGGDAPPSAPVAGDTGGKSPAPDQTPESKADQPELDKAEDEDGYHYRQDAIGRWYKYDSYGNRVYTKPLHGPKRE